MSSSGRTAMGMSSPGRIVMGMSSSITATQLPKIQCHGSQVCHNISNLLPHFVVCFNVLSKWLYIVYDIEFDIQSSNAVK